LEQVKVAFPDQYVLLDDLLMDEKTHGACAGRVIAHARTRREVLAAAPTRTPESRWALEFTGQVRIPPGFDGLFGDE
jgi:hypothetical protein